MKQRGMSSKYTLESELQKFIGKRRSFQQFEQFVIFNSSSKK